MDCWICGAIATTGEHKTKQSDLRLVLGKPSQGQPFYFHDKDVRNRPIGSYKGEFLKSSTRLCARCNNQLTQPYDFAWERMSEWLRTRRPTIKAGDIIRGNRIFPMNTASEMRGVHLFFTKLTGCHLIEAGFRFDQAALATSLLTGNTNPYIYLKFGVSRSGQLVGSTDLHASIRPSDDSLAFAVWGYSLNNLVIHVMYAIAGESREGLLDAWRARSGSNRLVLADFP